MVQSIDDARRRQPSRAGRVPPHDFQAEESLLGAMLLSRDAIASALEVCGPEDFYRPANGHIFDAIQSLYGRGEPVDPVTVGDELRRADLLEPVGGVAALNQLQLSTPATSNAGRYARIVEEHAQLRRLIAVAGEIAELGYEVPDDVQAAVDQAETLVFEIAQRRVTDTVRPLRDLLHDTLDRIEALYDRQETITGVPTGFIDLDERLAGLQASNLVIIGGRPSMGKCVAWDTPIVDPVTGAVRTAAEVHRRGTAGDDVMVASLAANRRLYRRRPSAFVDDGIKPVFRVRTRLGREVRTTASHPFLTPEGWRPLAELAVGTSVGVPARLPVFGTDDLPDAEVALVAYLVAGADTTGTAPRFVAPPPAVLDDLGAHASALGVDVLPERAVDGEAVYRLVPWCTAGLDALLGRHGLRGKGARGRRVPDAVFRLPRPQLALFLNRLLAMRARARWSTANHGLLSMVTSSKRFALDVQHLLLRFGVLAVVRERTAVRRGHARLLYELDVTAADSLTRLATDIGILGQEDALAGLTALRRTAKPRGTLPASLWSHAAQRMEVEQRSAIGVLDRTMAWARDDLYWDEIVAIEPDGDDQVYDLTVPGDHNFVAGDIFVHNTSFALNMAAHAAIHAQKPVLFFSLEMSHHELTQRLVCSEARVPSNRVRTGRLLDSDWPRISNAMGRLGEASMYIDDNPNITVMDIRTKARRLKSREGLDMVVVDYLQLMSGRSRAENRQVEVSEISRGLKILARELGVPVIALSQLSRNLELRSDKRPVLADLRESGSIEQDADVVMFIYRDEVYNEESADRGVAEIIVAKHRNGPTGKTKLAFHEEHTRFENLAPV